MNNVDISVCMITYYHEEYISQALNSVLRQKTKYKYEICISDDCSKDGTVGILKEYQRKYPEIIKLNINELNIGIPGNLHKARSMCTGRYVVHLSGDDYWINDNKIESQATFLDNNPDYDFVCVKSVSRINDNNKNIEYFPNKKLLNKEFTKTHFEKGYCMPLRGMMLRNQKYAEINIFDESKLISSKVDDAVDEYMILHFNKRVYCLDLLTDVYRIISKENAKNYNSLVGYRQHFKNSIEILNKLYEKYENEIDLKNRYYICIYESFRHILFEKSFKNYKETYFSIPKEFRVESNKNWILKIPFQTILWYLNYVKRK